MAGDGLGRQLLLQESEQRIRVSDAVHDHTSGLSDCNMSIPLFFVAPHEDQLYTDGGH